MRGLRHSSFLLLASSVICLRWTCDFLFISGFALGSRSSRYAQVGRAASGSQGTALSGLNVAIAGAGPSGLLLAHRLLDEGASVHIYESRSDPRSPEAGLEGRAYALGLGLRGRTALRTVDGLWDAVKPAGYGSEKFKLHLPFGPVVDLRKPSDSNGLEPSLLIYQSDLCGAMLDELQSRHGDSGRLACDFNSPVAKVDCVSGEMSVGEETVKRGKRFDIIAGCDGLNSRVRSSISRACRGFTCDRNELPGMLKVLRLQCMPDKLEADAVHAIPGRGGSSAFVEPTARGACVLVNWRDSSTSEEGEKTFSDITDSAEASEFLSKQFPLLEDRLRKEPEAAAQFVAQEPSRAATIRCNTYHHGAAVLLGDAAHSTGGASGQGCNSALQDAAALVEVLKTSDGDVPKALAQYSRTRVPEGHALLDLSTGPSSGLSRAILGVKNIFDGLGVTGSKQLQVELTTSLRPFADIRRDLDPFYGPFPTEAEFASSMPK